MNLDELLNAPPALHADASGRITSYTLDGVTLRYIDNAIKEMHSTLETGAGISTILFAMKYSNHTCIVPSENEVGRIVKYCEEQFIDISKISFRIDRSENMLPQLKIDELDLVLIDGRHAFPSPFIDWYYISPKLRLGGKLIIDDTQLWTGQILKEFLLTEPEWRLHKNFSRSTVFEKIQEVSHDREWNSQPFVEQRSQLDIPRNSKDVLRERIQNGLGLLRKGDFKTLMEKIFR